MAVPYLWLREELGPAVREHREPLSVVLGAPWFAGTRLWLGRTPPPIGRLSGSGLSRAWVVFEPPPLPATERVGPGIRIRVGTDCLLSCDRDDAPVSAVLCLPACLRVSTAASRGQAPHGNASLPLAMGTPGFGVSQTERLVCVVEIQVHARVAMRKNAKPISQPVWLGVGIEDPSGVVEIQVHSWGTIEKALTYIFSHKHMHVHTRPFSSFRHVVCSLSLQAGTSPMKFIKNMKSTPSQHAAPCNGNGGYPLPTRARKATRDKYPGGRDGPNPQRHPLPLKTPPTHGVTGQSHPLQFTLEYLYCRGRPLPLGLSPRRM